MTDAAPTEIFDAIAKAAADLGPAIEPPGYRDLLEWIVDTARQITGAAATSIATLDPIEEKLEFVAATGTASDQVVGLRMDAGKGIAGWALASGQSITISDAPSDPRFAADVAAKTGFTPRSVLAIPLEADSGTVGVMEILDAAEDRPDAHGASLLVASLAHQAAVAIETTHLFRDFGGVMFRAAARAADGAPLEEALARTAEAARGPARELAEILDLFSELGRLGSTEREAAVELLSTFLGYARASRG